MQKKITIADIAIRTELQPGDLGWVIYRHGALYKQEYDYGIEFENYVAVGLVEFYLQYHPSRDRAWICEHDNNIIGFLFLVHRPANTSQLRYFLIEPAYRGSGLGKRLMELFLQFHHDCGYDFCYLWTTDEQKAAAALYRKVGFYLAEEKKSLAFGKTVTEQRYELKQS
jgi:GNAT superfamily N-acetyltransferase